jgi:hypothetical protein
MCASDNFPAYWPMCGKKTNILNGHLFQHPI